MNARYALVGLLLAVFLLMGCIEREEGLENWTPAGSTIQPNKDLFPSPTPLATAQASAQASPSTAPKVTPSPLPSPSPSPAAVTCTVSVAPNPSGSYLEKQVLVKFTQDVSATVKCYSSASTQSVDLVLSSSGTYNGIVNCMYSQAGTYTASATAGSVSCTKQFTITAP